MTTVRISDQAIAAGAAAVERELVQLSVLASRGESGPLSLASDQDPAILELAKWRGVPIVDASAGEGAPISELWENRLRVSAVIACHNYGHYLDEAIRSLLAQTYLPDEIILSDDASTDESPEIMRAYAAKHPDVIRVNLNESNRGIQTHFNEVVAMAEGDLVVIIGADNRVPANYIEAQFTALAADDTVGLAYTDFALFGGRAKNDYERMLPAFQGEKLPNGVYLSDFPEYDEASAAMLREGNNFIHGSTMYRRSTFDQVGGYIDRKSGPEDMTLFQAMLETGLVAQKVTGTALEYRQHSAEQANYQFSYFGELQRLREEMHAFEVLKEEYAALDTRHAGLLDEIETLRGECRELARERDELKVEVGQLSDVIASLRASLSFRLGNSVVAPARRVVSALRGRRR
ncbi:glycosyltransferase [Leucobacter rhizosphaerae]|uniref:Glycosyltransferase n=1 Tax=Leucobacter rhizosphaerae TaxID=2932245 RepID=A0ABY4FUH8_9MICO|nr:glycosyltransferase [Leucobacter rhizosphaerae]UOQ59917.1 glycosyltransferase [Leucobacter rhizosphaerae]